MHSYEQYVNPYIGQLLREIDLDKRFIRGQGSYLYDEQGREYLDFIAAYGAMPFGYNPSRVWDALEELKKRQEPSFVQPSCLLGAGDLARALVRLSPEGLSYVTFTNSGAEAVEAAIKLVRGKTGRIGILSTENSFHGKTLGALSATGNPTYQEGFFVPLPGFRHIPYGCVTSLEEELRENPETYAGLILEPLQGEGGIFEPPPGYLKEAARICREHGVLLILDEIQTGLGRTGTLFACEKEQVAPDVMLLAKALGGGLLPIGAVLYNERAYSSRFSANHSSTFAGGSLGCRVGLRVLEILLENDAALVKEVAKKGDYLKRKVLAIKEQFPGVIQEVRGCGLMLGIDFGCEQERYPRSLLGVMAKQKILTPLIASYLLNKEGLRVAPTLNGASVIRVEPPLTISKEEMDRGLEGILKVVTILGKRNTARFVGHFLGIEAKEETLLPAPSVEPIAGEGDEGRFAFLVHPIMLSNYTDFDASLEQLDPNQLETLTERWNAILEPFYMSSMRITTHTGARAYGELICVPKTAKALLSMEPQKAAEQVEKAVHLAQERGARIVGLGAYTSVVTRGGRSLLGTVGVPMTTGNSYTVLSGMEALYQGAKELQMDLSTCTGAVLGATGAIGKASALLMAESVARLILIGNPQRKEKSHLRMVQVGIQIYQYIRDLIKAGQTFKPHTLGAYVGSCSLPATNSSVVWRQFIERELSLGCPIAITVDAETYLPQADVVLCATSSPEALIQSPMLKFGAVVCDVSRPANVSCDVAKKRPDVLVIDGGIIKVPHTPDLGWDFGFGKGLAYACLSETMMLGVEKHYENASLGANLNLTHIRWLRVLAEKHGFEVAGFRSFDRSIGKEELEKVRRHRKEGILAP